LDGIEALGVWFFAENNQLFWTGRKAKAAGLASFAVYADSAHTRENLGTFFPGRPELCGKRKISPESPFQSNTTEIFWARISFSGGETAPRTSGKRAKIEPGERYPQKLWISCGRVYGFER
jgi:hypothetical protein